MCGITGVVHFGDETAPAPIREMTARLQHRGPDATGIWESGGEMPRAQLGHTRLSIIDLAGSHQPMASADGRYVLVFNGEIYNYRELRAGLDYPFSTSGDTEVLLAGLIREGAKFVRRLRGQFAFAFYDCARGRLLLARDRVGVLPLYFHLTQNAVYFASEVKALLPALKVSPDLDSLDAYLAYGSVPAPFTLFAGVRKLLPGHTLQIEQGGRAALDCYWSPATNVNHGTSDETTVELLDEALLQAVEACLVSDVPVGAYLSGGLDSSLVVALMRDLQPQGAIATFSAGFGDSRFDETEHAHRVARLFGTEHHQVDVHPEDLVELWPDLTWYRDAPVSQPADIAVFRLAQAARQEVKVVLSGEGSDELFAGYPKYSAAPLTGLAGSFRAAAPFVDGLLAGAGRGRIVERAAMAFPRGEAIRTWFAPFPEWQRRRLLGAGSPRALPAYPATGAGMVSDILRHDLLTWLPDNLLERGDRMSMAAGLELRPPFLESAVVDLALRLPERMKVRGGRRKWAVKELAARRLPADIVERRKVGFRVPLDLWFRGGLRPLAEDLLISPDSFVSNLLDRRLIAGLLASHVSGRSNEERGLWSLMSLEMWHRVFFT
jgi:asparagine synthase (glutamine-hydrolysing)